MTTEALIESIYDAAIDPKLWPDVMVKLRDRLSCAFAATVFLDQRPLLQGLPIKSVYHISPWDEGWLEKTQRYVAKIPGLQSMMQKDIDDPWVQSEQCTAEELKETEFYKVMMQPYGLGDGQTTYFIKRQTQVGGLNLGRATGKPNFGAEERQLVGALTPHLRRAFAINRLVDEKDLAIALYKKILDGLSSAVFILSKSRNLILTNAAGERLLVQGSIVTSRSGIISTETEGPHAKAFESAVHAAASSESAMGLQGIGVPMFGKQGQIASAYVLPLMGSGLRAELGHGHAAVFVSTDVDQRPVMTEVCRTVLGLTAAEARVAALLASGENPQAIADGAAVAISTVRSQIKRIFEKTGTHDQPGLIGLLHRLVPPLKAGPQGGARTD